MRPTSLIQRRRQLHRVLDVCSFVAAAVLVHTFTARAGEGSMLQLATPHEEHLFVSIHVPPRAVGRSGSNRRMHAGSEEESPTSAFRREDAPKGSNSDRFFSDPLVKGLFIFAVSVLLLCGLLLFLDPPSPPAAPSDPD
eukprot:TRINITY_DN77684_c0_g1_i1.p2 TRINITY_DN77684_c0_g1~~TRINITY_DN77684_c0_g1_i1.p2  ORF type:complete len:139 (-),score=23.59 TRINITY_DN77684_c0_g1_i1:88-504(-)